MLHHYSLQNINDQSASRLRIKRKIIIKKDTIKLSTEGHFPEY